MKVGCSAIILLALVSMLACARSQGIPTPERGSAGKPSICDADSGKWDPFHINCDFDCDADGWEIKCKCDKENDKCDEIKCKIDRDGAPDKDDVHMKCKSNGVGASPTCPIDSIRADLPTCVAETITKVVDSWVIGSSN